MIGRWKKNGKNLGLRMVYLESTNESLRII